ncbi:MAG: hypothetical protein C4294_06605 [Nitrospiraceae bacterium]
MVLRWESKEIAALLEGCPHLSQNALRLLSGRVLELQERLRELSTERVERRVARALLRLARSAARRGLRLARWFPNNLPHALRENGLLAAMQGQPRHALRFLQKSLRIAEQQGARYEYAQSLLAKGQLGLLHGWADAKDDVATAKRRSTACKRTRLQRSRMTSSRTSRIRSCPRGFSRIDFTACSRSGIASPPLSQGRESLPRC